MVSVEYYKMESQNLKFCRGLKIDCKVNEWISLLSVQVFR